MPPRRSPISTGQSELADEPALRVNRGIGRHELGDHAGAISDYDRALASDDVDRAEVLYRRGLSHGAAGNVEAAAADWSEHMRLVDELGEPSEHAEEIAEHTPGLVVDSGAEDARN